MLTVDWILIADRSRANVLHAWPHHLRPFPTLASYIHAEGRLLPQERDSDAAGSVQRPGGARSLVEPHEDRWHVESRRFAKELGAVLERDRQSGRFDRLIVVAPPVFLGVLRETWSPKLREHVVLELAEDLMPLPDKELQERLAAIVSRLSETAEAER